MNSFQYQGGLVSENKKKTSRYCWDKSNCKGHEYAKNIWPCWTKQKLINFAGKF